MTARKSFPSGNAQDAIKINIDFQEKALLSAKKPVLWSFFSSTQLAIVLLILIALFSAVGTIVPQREAAADLAHHMQPGLFSFLQRMQIFDLYHSIWFFLLTGLLSLNLIVCSLDRLPMAWRRFRQRPKPKNEDVFTDSPKENSFSTTADFSKATSIAAAFLQKKYSGFQQESAENSRYFYADKGRFSIFGVFIVHLSILIMVAGAVLGSLFGLKGHVNIVEGETVSEVSLRNGQRSLSLPFSVRCDKFTVEFYENGAPKTYSSDLTFLRNNTVIYTGKLLVNHPIKLEGYRFYQSSYGSAGEGKAHLEVFKGGKKSIKKTVTIDDVFDLPGGEGNVHVLRIEEDLMKMGPAVKLAVRGAKSREETVFWVFHQIEKIKEMNPAIISQIPMLDPGLFDPYFFVLNSLEEKYFTGLQVSRDPATPVVAGGAALLICGLVLILFSYYRQVWIRVDQEKEQVSIHVAGLSNKNKAGLKEEISSLIGELRETLEHS